MKYCLAKLDCVHHVSRKPPHFVQKLAHFHTNTHTHVCAHIEKLLNISFCLWSSLQSLFCLSTLPKFPWKQEVVSPRTETVTALCCTVLISALMTFYNNFPVPSLKSPTLTARRKGSLCRDHALFGGKTGWNIDALVLSLSLQRFFFCPAN